MKRPWIWMPTAGFVAVCLLCVQVFSTYYKPLPDIRGSQKIILYSRQSDIEGADYSSGEMFHGEKVLGKVEITTPYEKAELLDVLYQAIAEGGTDWSCFEGRHALRFIKDNQTIDVLISFDCNKCLFIANGESHRVLLSRSGQDYFDELLKDAKVPLGFRP